MLFTPFALLCLVTLAHAGPRGNNLASSDSSSFSDSSLSQLDGDESGKRGWNALNGVWGKRANNWNNLNGLWGKRDWNDLSGMWGKRGWNELAGGWGKRPGWSVPSGMWDKRDWNNLQGMWGKRGWNSLNGAWGKRGWNNLKSAWGKKDPHWSARGGPSWEDIPDDAEEDLRQDDYRLYAEN